MIGDEERRIAEGDRALSDLPQWQQEIVTELRALDIDRLLPLPDRFDIHEWSIMRDFAAEQDEQARDALLDAVHGAGAFRSFKRELDHLGLRDAWFSYRRARFEQIATEWLEEHGLHWHRGRSSPLGAS
jgi:hypothetical protein